MKLGFRNKSANQVAALLDFIDSKDNQMTEQDIPVGLEGRPFSKIDGYLYSDSLVGFRIARLSPGNGVRVLEVPLEVSKVDASMHTFEVEVLTVEKFMVQIPLGAPWRTVIVPKRIVDRIREIMAE